MSIDERKRGQFMTEAWSMHDRFEAHLIADRKLDRLMTEVWSIDDRKLCRLMTVTFVSVSRFRHIIRIAIFIIFRFF